MSTAPTPTSSTIVSPSSSSSDFNLNPETCISLASSLRCYYTGQSTEIHHSLLIIPVALEVIFSTSLVFTNWRSGRRHLFLVAEGWMIFLLSLIEVLLFVVPAVRTNISTFRSVDRSIGALSFMQLLFYMSFLFAWVRGECFPIVTSRIRRIARPLLLMTIPAVITINTIASFVGVSYDMTGPRHVRVLFSDAQARFVWPFFSSTTLALLTVFQASCFLFAFYRFIRAVLTQRKIEADSKDAAVMFRGIGWINLGIKVGAIETVIGFVFFGIPIAYIRRFLRMFSRAFLSIGVAKGIDETEDFTAIRGELGSRSANSNFRRSRLRRLISDPRHSTFRQLSPAATSFRAIPRAPAVDYGLSAPRNEKPHPYAASAFLSTGKPPPSPHRNSVYAQFPIHAEKSNLSPPVISLPTMAQSSETNEDQRFQRSPQRVTVYYNHGTPTLHLRFSHTELPSPAVIAQSIKSRSINELISNTYGENVETSPQGSFKSISTPRSANFYASGRNQASLTVARDNRSPSTSTSLKFEPPAPAYFGTQRERLSDYSGTSGISAAEAEIVATPRLKMSILRPKSTLAKAVLYPVPGSKVAMALSTGEETLSSSTPVHRRLQKRRPDSPRSINSPKSSPPTSRPRSPPSSVLTPQPHIRDPRSDQKQRASFVRDSITNEDGNVIPAVAIAPSIDAEDYDSDGKPKHSTRALSGYSVGSVPETLQAVRDLARKFPGIPPGAVVGDIGLLASTMTPVKERDDMSSISGQSYLREASPVSSHEQVNLENTDTGRTVRKRIPPEMKMKGKLNPDTPTVASPVQRVQRPQPPPSPRSTQQSQLPRAMSTSKMQFTAQPIDPFDDDTTSQHVTASELSPLSMSVKLRHPQSFASTVHPSTRHDSTTRTDLTPPITPFSLSYYQNSSNTPSNFDHAQAREASLSPGVVDFGTALREWNMADRKRPGFHPTSDLHRLELIEGHRRSLSAHTRAEFNKQQDHRRQWRDSATSYDIDFSDELPDQIRQLGSSRNTTGASLNRIKSIGKAPRRITPQPTRGRRVRGSMHLQPLVIPTPTSSGKDVPISAVGAGGVQTILGVTRAGMNVNVAQERDDAEAVLSATTEATSINGYGVVRYSEVLSIEDGGYVPIRLQGSRKGSY